MQKTISKLPKYMRVWIDKIIKKFPLLLPKHYKLRASVQNFSLDLKCEPKGRALISYIVAPFIHGNLGRRESHQNQWEAVEIARIFNRLGYVVDIVNYDDQMYQITRDYDLLFGIGTNFERFAQVFDDSTLKVYYATGAHFSFQNRAEIGRLDWLEQRRGVRLEQRRAVCAHCCPELADFVICVGNEFTRSTYLPYNRNVISIDISSFDFLQFPNDKDFMKARSRFLWFGGDGMVHKGLDLTLEIFKSLSNLELYVAGPVKSDPDFVRVFQKEMFETPNIHLIGWVDVRSRTFERITHQCGYVVFPSCSEGQAGSVITCMHRGLVPIVTKESGVDAQCCGITLRNAQIRSLREAVLFAANQTAEALRANSRRAFGEARRRYTREAFSRNFQGIMQKLLQDR